MGPIPLIMLDWSTIRLCVGPPLKTLCGLSWFTEPLPAPLSLAYVIYSRSCMAPSTEYPPSADPVMHSFIFIPLGCQGPPDGPSRGADLPWTWLLRSNWQGTEASPFPERRRAALMCHAISVDRLMAALVPLLCANMNGLHWILRASVPTIPWTVVGELRQICWCCFEICKWVAL